MSKEDNKNYGSVTVVSIITLNFRVIDISFNKYFQLIFYFL